jgi:hypothetical protein
MLLLFVLPTPVTEMTWVEDAPIACRKKHHQTGGNLQGSLAVQRLLTRFYLSAEDESLSGSTD